MKAIMNATRYLIWQPGFAGSGKPEIARRNRITKRVSIIEFKCESQGRMNDLWLAMDKSQWYTFTSSKPTKGQS